MGLLSVFWSGKFRTNWISQYRAVNPAMSDVSVCSTAAKKEGTAGIVDSCLWGAQQVVLVLLWFSCLCDGCARCR